MKDALTKLKSEPDYGLRNRMLDLTINVLKRTKKPTAADVDAVKSFVLDEVSPTCDLVEKTKDYKIKDCYVAYLDRLAMLFTYVFTRNAPSDGELRLLKKLVDTCSAATVIENKINDMFKADGIDLVRLNGVLDIIKNETDEYKRGKFANGLLHYREKAGLFTPEAKNEITNYLNLELTRLLKNKAALTDNEKMMLEYISDVCFEYCDDTTVKLLTEICETLKLNEIRYFAIATLIKKQAAVSAQIIEEMANDLVYANLICEELAQNGKIDLFPAALFKPEYLAKSDMVHWLTYPTELDKPPDEIELLGVVKKHKDIYHVFKYKSKDSTCLSDDLKNEWLVGWSSREGNTFSHFDKLSDFEGKTTEKTLKNIAKTF
jgi:hypothetical protein